MSMKGKALVGLDLRAAQTHAAVLEIGSGELQVRRLLGPPGEVLSLLEQLGAGARVSAGSSSRSSRRARSRKDRSIGCRPTRRDAVRLARLLAAGELRFAFVPALADERFRELTRAVEDVRGVLIRARHRLSKFLLRRGERYGGPGRAWTAAHLRWLRGLRFDDACSRACFADDLVAVELLLSRRASLLEALAQAVPAASHAGVIARLRRFRGIDTLSAAGLAAEIGDVGRFAQPTSLSGFLALVPSERTPDLKCPQRSITKAGSPHARRLLVDAAHHYRRRPLVGERLARRQAATIRA